ncbi:MAG: hypothetical protein ACE5FD_03125 [Anaerolineae bacterium]
MAGKTNARWIRVSVDDSGGTPRDISSDVTNIDGSGLTYDETDVTGYSDGWHNVTLGHPDATVTITGPFNNTASTGSHTVFSGIVGLQSATITLTVQVGIKAAPTTGDPKWEGEYYCTSYLVNGDATYTAVLRPAGSTVAAWGTV